MNKFKTTTHAFFAIVCAFVIHSKSFAEPTNLSQLKAEIRVYHDSGAYQKELSEAIAPATRYLIQRSEKNETSPTPQKLAIVLDIDETTLSNYDHLVSHDFAYDKQTWDQHIMDANGSVIKPMLSFYNTALQQHVTVFFVTGRTESLAHATQKNLTSSGYKTWTGIYFKPEQYNQTSIATFKTQTRHDITKKGYTIIESIGDQQSDLTGGYAEKTFKLPNPYYYIP